MTDDATENFKFFWNLSKERIARDKTFSLEVNFPIDDLSAIRDGDYVFILENGAPVEVARIIRCRGTITSTEILLDRRIPMTDPWIAGWKRHHTGITVSTTLSRVAMDLLDDPLFATDLAQTVDASAPFAGMPEREIQRYIRELIVDSFEDDLLGPAQGPNEVVYDTAVRDRYITGRLPPKGTFLPPEEQDASDDQSDDAAVTDGNASGDDGKQASRLTMQPSSIGMSFTVDKAVEQIRVKAEWGRYALLGEVDDDDVPTDDVDPGVAKKSSRKLRIWKRAPHCGTVVVDLTKSEKSSHVVDPSDDVVLLNATVRILDDCKVVTLFLTNGTVHTGDKTAPDSKWIFQPVIRATGLDNEPIFIGRKNLEDVGRDVEMQKLNMLYRRRVEFAVGHGVSVHSEVSRNDPSRGVLVETRVIPKHEVEATETPGFNASDRPEMQKLVRRNALDMMKLAELSVPQRRDELCGILNEIADDYGAWIKELEAAYQAEPGIERPGKFNLIECKRALKRLREGIATLGSDDNALKAFGFANRAMALQRVRSIFIQRHPEGPESEAQEQAEISALMADSRNHTWRPFQLAFFLLVLPSVADPRHKGRTEEDAPGDLLWFPTGGGKTEAYLGAAAFTMAVRRIQPQFGNYDALRGLSVIMRYTLRLLTLQQFQRASTLICAMEVLRREDEATWGRTPFTIGLWVGGNVTPNRVEDAATMIRQARNAEDGVFQISRCPWCGAKLNFSNAVVEVEEIRTKITCPRLGCTFNDGAIDEGLPLKTVDEEIYRRPPSMLIATVDKFAQMALNGNVRTLFGFAEKECPRHGLVLPGCECGGSHVAKGKLPAVKIQDINPIRPPDLIVQDEFHLISGPLGTMVALYEAAIDDLCSWTFSEGGKEYKVRPKVVASSATVRKAAAQMQGVFYRKLEIFPPNGLTVEDNFFSVQRPVDEKPGRLYVGLCAPGSARPPVLIRFYVTLLTSAADAYERFGALADPFMTLVGYFISLRELGGMRRLVDDDVRTRMYRVTGTGAKGSNQARTYRPGMRNRALKTEIVELTSRVKSTAIPAHLEKIALPFAKKGISSPDVVLATNMLSVGVDVPRLGLMAINGQPKNTAEYIQASSRVGRSSPGLVCTAYAWGRPRDLSHYETFENYHATFYKHVEAQSVTPFSSRALDRGLSGAYISSVRLRNPDLAAEEGAQNFDESANGPRQSAESFRSRARKVTDSKVRGDEVKERLDLIRQRWDQVAKDPDTDLFYTSRGNSDRKAVLIKGSPTAREKVEWVVPSSMREVEPVVNLIVDVNACCKLSTRPGPGAVAAPDSDSGSDAHGAQKEDK